MPISGIVISCRGDRAEAVSARIASFDGVEVHGVLPEGRIVAVVEANTVQGEVDLVSELQEIDDVISVQLAYHNFEDI